MQALLKWFRNLTDTRRMAQVNRLIVKSSRRCARDLRHAASEISNQKIAKIYYDRFAVWSDVFWDHVQYRDNIYNTVDRLESDNAKLIAQIKSLGHIPVTQELPF